MIERKDLDHWLRNPRFQLLLLIAALFFLVWIADRILTHLGGFLAGLQGVLTPVFLSFLIAYLLDPVVDRFEKRGINRTVAILILLVLLFVGTGIMILLIGIAVRDFAEVIKTDLPNWLDHDVIPWLNHTCLPWISSALDLNLAAGENADFIGPAVQELRTHLTGFVPRLVGPVQTIITSALSGTVALLAWVANIIMVPLFSFYLLRDFDKIMAKARSMLPRKYEHQVIGFLKEIDETIAAFVRGQLLVVLILGVLYGLGLTIFQVRLGFGIGMIAGLLCVIPYLGFFAGIGMAILMSLIGGENLWLNLIGTGVTFGVVQALEGTIITPKIVGDKVGLHPVWVILALMVGAQILGILGMLLAIPAAAVVKIILVRTLRRYKQSELFQGKEPEAAPKEKAQKPTPHQDKQSELSLESDTEEVKAEQGEEKAQSRPEDPQEEPDVTPDESEGVAQEKEERDETQGQPETDEGVNEEDDSPKKTLPDHPGPEVKKKDT